MKALVLKEYKQFRVEDLPMPEYGHEDILIRVKACAICGSDVHGMDGSTGRRIPPIIMGHEASGIIEKVGANVKDSSRVTGLPLILPFIAVIVITAGVERSTCATTGKYLACPAVITGCMEHLQNMWQSLSGFSVNCQNKFLLNVVPW